ncbi:MAG: DNA/RNA non-specific endonuclease [Litorimonas sp.]
MKPKPIRSHKDADYLRKGYDINFLSRPIPLPYLSPQLQSDLAELKESKELKYTHFSVLQSKSYKFPYLVAWNIKGDDINSPTLYKKSMRLDSRVKAFQHGGKLYDNNPLDKGHVARQKDLSWGTDQEAVQAEYDSCYYTNIIPQYDSFNRSSLKGIWGELENTLLEQVEAHKDNVSVFGGPSLHLGTTKHSGIDVPHVNWKVFFYEHPETQALQYFAFVLVQLDLGVPDLKFVQKTYDFDKILKKKGIKRVNLQGLEAVTGLSFSVLKNKVDGYKFMTKSFISTAANVKSLDDAFKPLSDLVNTTPENVLPII